MHSSESKGSRAEKKHMCKSPPMENGCGVLLRGMMSCTYDLPSLVRLRGASVSRRVRTSEACTWGGEHSQEAWRVSVLERCHQCQGLGMHSLAELHHGSYPTQFLSHTLPVLAVFPLLSPVLSSIPAVVRACAVGSVDAVLRHAKHSVVHPLGYA